MKARIQRWGNSLAVRIPRSVAEDGGMENGTLVELSVADGSLVITPIATPSPTLEELVDQITPDNVHGEVDWGHAVGRELW
ncbi:MAG: AbrB/MazE/SpoVT family DNA-binding domain-containing protein [Chloroflexi bacterium]|nr:AbrB/MazE/SpoVT family DNA-binding domain-containing protein [Chloroflexota bacterium]